MTTILKQNNKMLKVRNEMSFWNVQCHRSK